MTTRITSRLFSYDKTHYEFTAEASSLPMFKTRVGFIMVSHKTDMCVEFTYASTMTVAGETSGHTYIGYVRGVRYVARVYND